MWQRAPSEWNALDQVTEQVGSLVKVLGAGLLSDFGLPQRPTFRKNDLHPALEAGLVERTVQEKPKSR